VTSGSGFRLPNRRARQDVEAPKRALGGERVRRDTIITHHHLGRRPDQPIRRQHPGRPGVALLYRPELPRRLVVAWLTPRVVHPASRAATPPAAPRSRAAGTQRYSRTSPSGVSSRSLIQPAGLPPTVRVTWPAKPTIVQPRRFAEVAGAAVRILAGACTKLSRIKASTWR
jgi:hypothetical protein